MLLCHILCTVTTKIEGVDRSWEMYGGTAITMDKNVRSHKSENSGSSKDNTCLRRWTWFRTKGKENTYTRFISAYRPCASKKGIETVWAQHQKYFRDKGILDPDPIKLFDDDLCKEIQEWLDIGDSIVLGIDMNEDVGTGKLARQFKNMDLKNAVFSLHSESILPATYSKSIARKPIDAIWVSSNLEVERAGYLPFKSKSPAAPSNGHQMLWAEINNHGLFGKDIPFSLPAFKGTKLNSKHPHLRRKYNANLKALYSEQKVF